MIPLDFCDDGLKRLLGIQTQQAAAAVSKQVGIGDLQYLDYTSGFWVFCDGRHISHSHGQCIRFDAMSSSFVTGALGLHADKLSIIIIKGTQYVLLI